MNKPLRHKNFYDYTVYEDGTIYGKNGNPISIRTHNGRGEVRLMTPLGRKNFLLARLLYWLFVEEFDLSNKDLCVTFKDGDKLNTDIDNLVLVERKDLIQGEKHRNRVLLTDEEIEEIKAKYSGKACVNQYDKSGVSLQDLADEYNCTKANIKSIVKGKSRNKANYKLK